MAVLNLSAHSLDYKETIGGHENENGDWVQGVETWIENYCKCDIVPAGKANVITIPDIIRIKLFGKVFREFKVLGFHRYQLQCKIWV